MRIAIAISLVAMLTSSPTFAGSKPSDQPSRDTYTNADLGLQFKLPQGWEFYEDEEVAKLEAEGKERHSRTTNEPSPGAQALHSSWLFGARETTAPAGRIPTRVAVRAPGRGELPAGITSRSYLEAMKRWSEAQGMAPKFTDVRRVKIGSLLWWALTGRLSEGGVDAEMTHYAIDRPSGLLVVAALYQPGQESLALGALEKLSLE